MLLIGVTGGIGAGKSIVASVFRCLGIPVYDADSHAKALMTTDGILQEAIKKEFGTLSFTEQGRLNRAYLASQVFTDPDKLKKLNRLVHPRVAEDFEHWVEKQKSEPTIPYVIKEAALLFDSGSNRQLDKIIVVTAPDVLRIQRVQKRDGRTSHEIEQIFERQMSQEEMIRRSDFTVLNDESRLITPQLLKLHDIFLQLKK
ncbi:MAG: dephospho-CoA kinase [Cyclobacteriaceae bacterium]